MTSGHGRPRRRRAVWAAGGVSASLAVALACGAAGGAVAAEQPRVAAAPAPAAGDRCEEDGDRRRENEGAGRLTSWFPQWGLGDRAALGCEGEWDRCDDRPLPQPGPDGTRPDQAVGEGREHVRPGQGAGAAEPATQAGAAPRAAAPGGACETPDGLTEVVGDVVEVAPGGTGESVAVCPEGMVAVSGGWSTTEPGLVAGVSQRLGVDGWRVVLDNPAADGEPISGLAFAYCEDEDA
ncbi:hypothetical protein [Streptomyces sp. NPDC005012]|uniref:hypothetical protein n=1 Tax=Streptomyces sp. NPDC005012 TaxID=3154558 RepID=UPI0033A13C94